MLFITSIENGYVAVKLKYSLHKVIEKHQAKWNQKNVTLVLQVIIGDQEAPAKGELEVEVLHGEEIGDGLIALKSLDTGDFLIASLNLAPNHYQGGLPQQGSQELQEGILVLEDGQGPSPYQKGPSQ